ncbi:MAG: hypothetical protein NT075_32090 [Chloroflexi bacterium]|nr:hypothetical protein [Chloroflexota bacterium]
MYNLTRREFLKAVGLSSASIVLVACQSATESPPAAEAAPTATPAAAAAQPAPAASARGFTESPMLASPNILISRRAS